MAGERRSSNIENADVAVRIEDANKWRTVSPGVEGWSRTARPGDEAKFLMVSADSHANEPPDLWMTRMGKKFHHRLPRIVERPDGLAQVTEGFRALSLAILRWIVRIFGEARLVAAQKKDSWIKTWTGSMLRSFFRTKVFLCGRHQTRSSQGLCVGRGMIGRGRRLETTTTDCHPWPVWPRVT